MNYFTKVLKYGLDYTYYGVLNIIFNILYAIFSALAFVSFIPMLDVLFKQTKDVYSEPEYSGISNIREYFCLLYTSPSPRDWMVSRMPSSA